MFIHQLTKNSTDKSKKRVGRGGSRGKTSGKGMKGQNSRAGNSKRPHERDLLKQIPKLRGHGKNRSHTVISKPKAETFNLGLVNLHFKSGETVSPATLYEKGLITLKVANNNNIKILATGELKEKLNFVSVSMSEKAKEMITKVGGSVS